MNTRATLSLLAATMLPALPLQAEESCSQVLASMAGPATRTATAEVRAAVFSSLAHMPSDVDDFIALTHISEHYTLLRDNDLLPGHPSRDADELLQALDSVAIGSSSSNAAGYRALAHITARVIAMFAAEEIGYSWSRQLSKENSRILRNVVMPAVSNWQNEAISLLPQVKVHPVYAIATAKPGCEGILHMHYNMALRNLQMLSRTQEGIEPVYNMQGFSGIRISPPTPLGSRYNIKNAAEWEASTRILYILLKREGNAIIAVACEDPSEIRSVSGPADSLLATDKLRDADAHLRSGMVAAGQLSSELLSALTSAASDTLQKLAGTAANAFRSLKTSDSRQKQNANRAAQACETIASQLKPLLSPVSKPVGLQLWYDGDLNLQLSMDAQGAAFTPAPLRHFERVNAPNTIFYAATSPCPGGLTLPSPYALAESIWHINVASYESTNPGYTAWMEEPATVWLPAAKGTNEALRSILSGLDGNAAFILEAENATLPTLLNSDPPRKAKMPRAAFSFGVSDRSRLAEGWDKLLATASAAAGKLGYDPDTVNMLPIVPARVGEATRYTLSLPVFNPDFVPTLSVSDRALVMGSSMKLNDALMRSSSAGGDFAGAVCVFRPAPLADSLESVANALAEPEQALDDEDDYNYYRYRSPQQRQADDLRYMSQDLRDMSRVIKAIYGTATTQDGRFLLNFRVDFR